ncbi:MAG: hypothetical protein HOM11_09610 [Methylococcales bacterium]|jgi:hypothetical protein|nr:hypothetical protein [Methylococcales bacterium]MBT7442538.1 hypothetical protein [Methylococcales bacterium]
MINIKIATLITLLITSSTAMAYQTNVIINGKHLSSYELQQRERAIGTKIVPGNYSYNAYTTCWVNHSNGTSGCLNKGNVISHNGRGERTSDGSSFYRSNAADYSVGKDANGCIYTPNWSNC